MSATRAMVARRQIDILEIPIFAEILTRVSRFTSLADYAYAGMSGFALDDQRKLYRTLELRSMLSFDPNNDIVRRQRFNLPAQNSQTGNYSLKEFATDWRGVLASEGIEDVGGYIIWVRSDSDDEAGRDVRYFQSILNGMPLHSIARITLRTDYDYWAGPRYDGERRRTVDERAETARASVSDVFGEFLEMSDVAHPLPELELYAALAKAAGSAAAAAVSSITGQTFEPLSVIRYGAGPVFLTLTGMIVETDRRSELRAHIEEGLWPFASSGWSDVKDLRLPDLTMKERFELEAAGGNLARAVATMHFDLDQATGEPGLFESFSRYHRFLPQFVTAEL